MPETKKYMLAFHEDPQRFLQHVRLYFSLNSQKKNDWVSQMQKRYLLLTEFEGRTVSYGPSFFLLDLWPEREARGP